MKKSKNDITEWLKEHGDPEVEKQVEKEAAEIMKEQPKTDGLIEQWRKSIKERDMVLGKDLTSEHIKEAVNHIFRQEPREKAQKVKGDFIDVVDTERKIKLISYCKEIDGAKKYGSSPGEMNLCGHPECRTCRRFEKSFREVVKEQLERYESKDNMLDA